MGKIYLIILFICYTSIGFTQGNIELTSEERAYLYHIVKKSPILDNSIGRYFEYKGPEVRLMNKEINFDSIENIIINDPTKLYIRTSEIGKSPKGIIAEAANKMALWELNKTLLAAKEGGKDFDKYRLKYLHFETKLVSKLPESAVKVVDDVEEPHKKILLLLNPSLSFEDKAALLSTYNFLTEDEQLLVIDAINETINWYVEERSLEIYLCLGGTCTTFQNELIAAGDGSETSGLLNEREKDENGRWNKGLPKAVGLFPYEARLKPKEKRDKTVIEPLLFPILDFQTVGENRLTQLHFDVWGYNSKKQTTVVIERNGKCYHLFGSAETRFLSPDSTFGSGKTFHALMMDLQRTKIDPLNEKLYGKKGFEFQIEDAHKKKDDVELRIMKNEKEYSDMGYQPITTSKKAPRSVKKAKKKAQKNGGIGYQHQAQPKTDAQKKQKRKSQNEIVELYNQFEYYTNLIKQLEIEKAKALELLAKYQRQMDSYQTAFGRSWVNFTEKDGFYLFEDSSTFDLYTQEFTFQADTLKTPFEVRLLAIPNGPSELDADEVMMHVNLVDSKPGFDARVQLQLNDVFKSNEWSLNKPLLQESDSVSLQVFFEALQEKKVSFEAIGRGNGVGEWNGVKTVRAQNRQEWQSYGGFSLEEQNAKKMDTSMVRLRTTEVNIFLNRGILLEVNTFTDPVKTNLTPKNAAIAERLKKYGLTGNDYLSAMRTATVIAQLKQELNVKAGVFLPREKAKIVIDRMNKELDAMRVSVGATSFTWQELLEQK